MYDIELKRKWDRANILAHAREQGKEEGLAEGKAEVVSNLLQAGRFSVEEIAKYANVPVSFVLEVRDKLSNTKK
jgi:predicted transposase YdaD